MLLVVILAVSRAQLGAFRAYEHTAAKIMARHGGAIERALVVDDGGDALRELHIVRFADAEGFARYQRDPELHALAEDRGRCVLHTEVLRACEGPAYTRAATSS